VRQPIELMGRSAVALLISQVGGAPASSEELFFEPELVVRGSTGPVAAAETLRTAGSVS
jgi:DNA-binding LacI/PurR family transcriptional regulator